MSVMHHEGKITYLNAPRIGAAERRTHAMNDVRVIVDAAIELQQQVSQLQAIVRGMWPELPGADRGHHRRRMRHPRQRLCRLRHPARALRRAADNWGAGKWLTA